jgi:hypothetical protein
MVARDCFDKLGGPLWVKHLSGQSQILYRFAFLSSDRFASNVLGERLISPRAKLNHSLHTSLCLQNHIFAKNLPPCSGAVP